MKIWELLASVFRFCSALIRPAALNILAAARSERGKSRKIGAEDAGAVDFALS